MNNKSINRNRNRKEIVKHIIQVAKSLPLSQMATYWFVIGWLDIQKAQKKWSLDKQQRCC